MKKSLPNFIEVFEKRINTQREKIKEELKKDKKLRDRKKLKHLLSSIKDIRKTVKKAKAEHVKKCPHCGEKL